MSLLQQIWFFILSIANALILGFFFTMATLEVVRDVLHPADSAFPTNRDFQIYLVIFVILILCLQVLRIAFSLIRVDDGAVGQPMAVSFWTWQTNPQGLGLLLAVGALILYIGLGLTLR